MPNLLLKIPNTFCPAKWDELHLNYNYKWAYGCCKATPIVFVDDWREQLDQQKQNLLNGVQDPSCDYCWKVENNGGVSDRHGYIKNFDQTLFPEYLENLREPSTIEVNLGNECNFQCTYCSPQFSSKWDTDMRSKPYKIKSDMGHFRLNSKQADNIESNLTFLNKYQSIDVLNILGGEPLQNKRLFKMLDDIDNVKNLHITTNFSCKKETIDQIIERSQRYDSVRLGISLDATGKIAEFTRYGMNWANMIDNIEYLISHAGKNIEIRILTLLSSLTIHGIDNLTILMKEIHGAYPNTTWRLSYCVSPKIQSFKTLINKEKYLNKVKELGNLPFVLNSESVYNELLASEYDNELRKELDKFLNEFSQRKQIEIPKEFYAQTE